MESLYILVPVSLVLVFVIAWAFWRALESGQFDDLDRPSQDLLADDDRAGSENRGQTPISKGTKSENRGQTPISEGAKSGSVPKRASMLAMRLYAPHEALRAERVPVPVPGPGQVLIEVAACGVCRTDLHVVDGDLTEGRYPLVPGHEIVGRVVKGGSRFTAGTRVGVPWLGWTCGVCEYCASARENLCPEARFTGYTLDGGYAEYALADERFCFALPERYGDAEAAPLLCAGLIGYRSYAFTGDGRTLGLYGFGAAAHLLAQVAKAQGKSVFAFVRPGDEAAMKFARECGADWAGGSDQAPPEPLDAAILFAPVGALLPQALAAVKSGGRVVCGGIHMSDIPSFPYALLWGERRVQSVANLTRADGEAFMRVAAATPLRAVTRTYPLAQANQALADLREGRLEGAAVLLTGV